MPDLPTSTEIRKLIDYACLLSGATDQQIMRLDGRLMPQFFRRSIWYLLRDVAQLEYDQISYCWPHHLRSEDIRYELGLYREQMDSDDAFSRLSTIVVEKLAGCWNSMNWGSTENSRVHTTDHLLNTNGTVGFPGYAG